MKSLFLIPCLLILSAPAYSQINPRLPNPNVTRDYDRFKDETTIRFRGGDVAIATPRLMLNLFVSFKGVEIPRIAPSVGLILTSTSEDWQFLRSQNVLRAILDNGKPITLGDMKRSLGTVYRGGVIEHLTLEVPLKTIIQLSQAKKVEMQVAQTELQLSPEQISGLKDFVHALQP